MTNTVSKSKDIEKEKAFDNWKHNAIYLTFPNGNSLSTTWAYGSYSDNHDIGITPFETFRDSNTVEIMILKAPKKLVNKIQKKYDFEDDTVKGYLTMSEWLDVVKMLSK